jgi:hypothetical protein
LPAQEQGLTAMSARQVFGAISISCLNSGNQAFVLFDRCRGSIVEK